MTTEAMTICTRERIGPAPTLWPDALDVPIRSMAETRNIAGDFCESATAALLGGRRIRTDARFDVCPDVMIDARTFVESKSVGTNAQAIIYCHRMDKDLSWTCNGGELFYCLWHHRASVSGARYAADACAMIAATVQFACILSLVEIAEICRGRAIKILNRKSMTAAGAKLGYGSNGYGVGWSIPLKLMLAVCCGSIIVPAVVAAGVSIEAVSVRYSPMSEVFVRAAMLRSRQGGGR